MCTLTVFRNATRLAVTMNRDELHERREDGVARNVGQGVAMTFPVDAEAMGSWIGVNAHGVVLCLLNRYDKPARSDCRSRGAIIPQALAQGSHERVLAWLCHELDPDQYNPFTLVAVISERPFRIDWNGRQRFVTALPRQGWYMATSSSEDYSEVRRYRRDLFEDWLLEGASYRGRVPEFHVHHNVNEASKSPLMQRAKSHTKSITQIDVLSEHAELVYYNEECVNELRHEQGGVLHPSESQRLDLHTVS